MTLELLMFYESRLCTIIRVYFMNLDLKLLLVSLVKNKCSSTISHRFMLFMYLHTYVIVTIIVLRISL